jgi:hypothetical protein
MNLFHTTVQAAEKWKNLGGDNDVATIGSIGSLFENFVSGITAFAGVVLFIVLVSAGFTFLFSGGDQKQLEKAKNSFTYALIGIIVIASAYLVIQLVGNFIGIDLTKFQINIKN